MAKVLAYMTAGSVEDAKRLGRALLEERLCACVNILPGMTSLYHWQDTVAEDREVVVIAKTRAELFDRLVERVDALHGYSVPCVLELPVGRGHPEFLAWLERETA